MARKPSLEEKLRRIRAMPGIGKEKFDPPPVTTSTRLRDMAVVCRRAGLMNVAAELDSIAKKLEL